MKLSTLLLIAGGMYLASKSNEAQALEARSTGLGLNTTLAPDILSGSQLQAPPVNPDESPVLDSLTLLSTDLINQVSSDRLWGLFQSVNYYAAQAQDAGIHTDLVPLTGWSLEGDYIRFTDRNGHTMKMSYPEWSNFVNVNTKPIASITGDWSHYSGD